MRRRGTSLISVWGGSWAKKSLKARSYRASGHGDQSLTLAAD